MILNDIDDIRIFWSTDSGFLSQFKYEDPKFIKNIKYKVNIKKINWPIISARVIIIS